MGDGEALLRAILDQPKEETPRLVYADWLEENAETVVCPKCHGRPKSVRRWKQKIPTHTAWKDKWKKCEACNSTGRISDGQPERAEFIRVQVTIARWGTTPPADAEEWVRRERELRWAHGLKWALPATEVHHSGPTGVGPSAGHILGFFSRGFVSHVSCSWPDWRTHADAILAAQPVERVRLTMWPPAFRHPDDVANFRGACKFRWPRIEFELPPERAESLREWWENHTQEHEQ
jgi:uncharacterized protein (TIGR02996 family)